MKIISLLAIVLLVSLNSCAQTNKNVDESSTYYFIRNAEKDRSNPSDSNPHLNDKGQERANNWSTYFNDVKFDAVYATDYNRTQETAKPTANKNNVSVITYDPSKIANPEWFLTETKGKTILIVGHSDTTPAFVNAIIGQKKYENIDDSVNGNLFIVTIKGDEITSEMKSIN